MKKRIKFFTLTCLIGVTLIWYSCQKESVNFETAEINFNVFSKVSTLKNTKAYKLGDAEKVIITIQEDDGTPTEYSQYELKVHKMGDAFITNKIVLPFGNYKLTEFFIIDDLDSITFVSPLEGSLMAQHVDNALPILFDVTEKKSKGVDVEVISSEKLKPEDFGLIRFPIIEIETFQFIISVSELGTDQLLLADLKINSDNYTYLQDLDSIIDNIVTIKDGYENYILTIESTGFQDYIDTLTNAELKQYDTSPLIIELEKVNIPIDGLVAYYPFNGNANDESLNSNDGIVNGAILTTDRFGNGNSAYNFDGVDDKIIIPSSETFKPQNSLSVTLWAYIDDYESPSNVLVFLPYRDDGSNYSPWVTYTMYAGWSNLHPAVQFNTSYWVLPENSPINQWYMSTITWDGTNVKIYINGILKHTGAYTGPIDYGTSGDLGIGGHPYRATTDGYIPNFDGLIDEVRIYNRALNEEEIVALYNE